MDTLPQEIIDKIFCHIMDQIEADTRFAYLFRDDNNASLVETALDQRLVNKKFNRAFLTAVVTKLNATLAAHRLFRERGTRLEMEIRQTYHFKGPHALTTCIKGLIHRRPAVKDIRFVIFYPKTAADPQEHLFYKGMRCAYHHQYNLSCQLQQTIVVEMTKIASEGRGMNLETVEVEADTTAMEEVISRIETAVQTILLQAGGAEN